MICALHSIIDSVFRQFPLQFQFQLLSRSSLSLFLSDTASGHFRQPHPQKRVPTVHQPPLVSPLILLMKLRNFPLFFICHSCLLTYLMSARRNRAVKEKERERARAHELRALNKCDLNFTRAWYMDYRNRKRRRDRNVMWIQAGEQTGTVAQRQRGWWRIEEKRCK